MHGNMALPAPYLEQRTHTVGTCTSDPQFQTRLKNGRGFESKKKYSTLHSTASEVDKME